MLWFIYIPLFGPKASSAVNNILMQKKGTIKSTANQWCHFSVGDQANTERDNHREGGREAASAFHLGINTSTSNSPCQRSLTLAIFQGRNLLSFGIFPLELIHQWQPTTNCSLQINRLPPWKPATTVPKFFPNAASWPNLLTVPTSYCSAAAEGKGWRGKDDIHHIWLPR